MKLGNCRTFFVLMIIVAVASLVNASDLHTEYFDKTFPLADGGSVSLENVNGDVMIEVWDQAEVRVQAEKKASSIELLQDLKVEVRASESSIDIDTEYPNNRSRENGENRRMSVEYTLTVPRYAVLDDIELVNGDLEVIGVQGGVNADLVNGTVTARDLAGEIELATVNGSVDITVADFADVSGVDLESVNGAVELNLPSYANATLDVETVNGKISNDFGLEVKKGKYVGASLNGDIGGGGVEISIETVNGRIEINGR